VSGSLAGHLPQKNKGTNEMPGAAPQAHLIRDSELALQRRVNIPGIQIGSPAAPVSLPPPGHRVGMPNRAQEAGAAGPASEPAQSFEFEH
jgi:hypothetical protein